ncbi:hypothetical protein BC936DRAFT_138334 [Jimgerdemannia flammicorona]|uniref:Kinesin motor domain-containing protein n=1 Tax=Jimgerdemannia flammicorona TaxID=994334 RepID=A0A433CMP8_9FUNG|nr:hypothetical protein BC936DRAFT_138334 [Jimgerdemannia flammicorona]
MSGNNIKVVCRFRPQNKLEISEGGVPIIDIDEEGTSVALNGQEFQGPPFAFDKVFGMDSKQKDIFDYSIKSIVDGLSLIRPFFIRPKIPETFTLIPRRILVSRCRWRLQWHGLRLWSNRFRQDLLDDGTEILHIRPGSF